MPRTKRPDEARLIDHAINRGNSRRVILHKQGEYQALLFTLREGLDKQPIELLAYCLMLNRRHLVLRPQTDGVLGKYCNRLPSTHTLRYHAQNPHR
ncbi:MAG: hypothetical protein AAF989_11920 [Planctomycetota bacterium]